MKKETFENLKEMLEREVTEITKKGEIDSHGLDHVFKLVSTIKNIDKCLDHEGGYSGYMSYEGRYDGRSNRSYDGSYDGRYSEDNFRSYQNRSYDNSYTGQSMKKRLEDMLNETSNEQTKMAIMDCLNRIK